MLLSFLNCFKIFSTKFTYVHEVCVFPDSVSFFLMSCWNILYKSHIHGAQQSDGLDFQSLQTSSHTSSIHWMVRWPFQGFWFYWFSVMMIWIPLVGRLHNFLLPHAWTFCEDKELQNRPLQTYWSKWSCTKLVEYILSYLVDIKFLNSSLLMNYNQTILCSWIQFCLFITVIQNHNRSFTSHYFIAMYKLPILFFTPAC